MAGLLRKRKGKAPASTSEASRFKILYHESHFNKFFAAREVFPEIRIKIDDDVLSPISAKINLRKWQRLTKPFLTVGYSLVREFYANAWRLEEQKNQLLTYTTQIRGTKINFSPESIHRVLIHANNKLGTNVQVRQQNQYPIQAVLPKRDWTTLQEAKVTIPGDTLILQEDPLDRVAIGRVRGPREPRQHQQVEEEAPQQFQQQQNLPPDFMASFNNTMATM
ncbi:hypothetical protein PIB30_066049 [Stylosanthes scabra]|uniref:Uncharacterized protein n=1 Tax=Stylosanthes scabra TaxID=79078 RepID=A0ABU6YL24_9FABA|nr:hypothetical protein [Stylosanthes scabra]